MLHSLNAYERVFHAFVKAHRYELPEISVELQPRRRYTGGELAAHALGYVGEVTETQLMTSEFMDFRSGDQIGQTGLERQYNNVLRGQDGFKRVIVNSFGREMGKLEEQEATPGNDLVTTIDLDLQRADARWVKRHLTVMGARTQLELRGIACIPLETEGEAKQFQH